MRTIAFDADGRPLVGTVTFGAEKFEVQLRGAVRLREPVRLREQPLLPQLRTVSADVAAERLAVCQACDKAKDGVCVACSCGADRRLERLVTREETGAVKWCRHPQRPSCGCGWAR